MSTSILNRIGDLTAWLTASSIDELELRGPGGSIRLVRANGTVTTQPARALDAAAAGDEVAVKACSAGVFLDRHPLQDHPNAQEGAPVSEGDILGFLRMGILLTPVVAPVSGDLIEMRVSHLATVGFSEPLFAIAPQEAQEAQEA